MHKMAGTCGKIGVPVCNGVITNMKNQHCMRLERKMLIRSNHWVLTKKEVETHT
eukprot:SAG31_NODE_3618_length_4063_cov_2.665237_6_plen_54_part_00